MKKNKRRNKPNMRRAREDSAAIARVDLRRRPADLVSGGDRGANTPLPIPKYDFPPTVFDPAVLCACVHFFNEVWNNPAWTETELLRVSRSIRVHIESSGPLVGLAYKLVHPSGAVASFSGPEVRALFAIVLDKLAILQGIQGGLRGAGGESPAYTEVRFIKEMLRCRHIAGRVWTGWKGAR